MDVDLLRTGTVPIAPDTVLWFEFLLHQDLLLKHLQKPNPDPNPVELITKFYDAITETLRNRLEIENVENGIIEPLQDNSKHPAKSIALKLLSLKIAAFIKWNLSQLRMLPFKTQITLLQDLLYFTNEKTTAEIPNINVENIESLPLPYLFGLIVYHRWLLNVTMHRITSNWNMRILNNEISPIEETVICSLDNVKRTVDFLSESLKWTEIPKMLTFDCFKLPTENDSLEVDWDNSEILTKDEFQAQINYDLGTFFFYKEDYNLAKQHFTKCLENYRAVRDSNGFMNINIETLQVYVRACNGPEKGNLFEQFNTSIVNHYMGITTILQQDNVNREIPLVHRLNLELNIQGALSSGTFTVAKDLLHKVRILNIIRCVLDQKPLSQYSSVSLKNCDILIWSIESTWKLFDDNDKNLIKRFLMDLILKKEIPELLSSLQLNPILSQIFDKSEISYIKQCDPPLELPESLNRNDWILYDFTKKRKPKMELKQLEQQLIASYDHKEIRDLITKISMNPLTTNIWCINPKWELPIPLQSVLKSLSRGFLQDYGFVLLTKAREQMLNKNWNTSLELMIILDKELDTSNSSAAKLSRLISWEILLVQITQLFEDWPHGTVDKLALANACEACLQTNDTVLPRTEIIEQCIICLLNLGRWEFLINFDKRWSSLSEITSAIALACQELVKHKGNKKLSKNLWDIILPIFTIQNQTKRNTNSNSSIYLDNSVNNLKNKVMDVFTKLRDSTVFTVVISMLARLHNVLKDESSLELQTEYAMLWPAVISNANSYNTKTACEMLTQIVLQGLHYYPANIPWLRLMGDINFANGYYNVSLKYYLKSLLIYHDYFNIPVRHDDHVFRRMIKCCMALGCYTQAAVLCQFLEEPDYSLAFKILGEQKYCNDAVDAYYHCIWDTNLLEYLIHIHNRRGEYQRRKCATQVIGLLELNSNNNEEIQREASNLRKSTFLRALCKQYVFEN